MDKSFRKLDSKKKILTQPMSDMKQV